MLAHNLGAPYFDDFISYNSLTPSLIQVNRSKYTVKDTKYILSLNINKQLMIMVQKTHKLKERACPHLQRRLVNMRDQTKWSHNIVKA